MSENSGEYSSNNYESSEPRLGDILALEASIEAANSRIAEQGSGATKDTSPTERIAIFHDPEPTFPLEAYLRDEGKEISRITMQQKNDEGNYQPVMYYMVLRDGDETTTRLIKRPPIKIPESFEGDFPPTKEQSAQYRADVKDTFAKYNQAKEMGLYDITVSEVNNLRQLIDEKY